MQNGLSYLYLHKYIDSQVLLSAPNGVIDTCIIISNAEAQLLHKPDFSVVIVNLNSKGGQTGKNWDSIKQILIKYFGNDLKILFTEKAGDWRLLAQEHLQKGSTHIIPICGDGIINEVTNGFFKKYNNNLDSVDFKNSKHDVLVELTDVEPVNPDAIMIILPGGTHNVMIWSLGLPLILRNVARYFQHLITSRGLMLLLQQ